MGFGRLWLAPALSAFQTQHPRVTVQLQLTEQLPDLGAQGYDGAVWLWSAPGHQSGQWVSRRLARNQRVLVAAPSYLRQHGQPQTPADLTTHACLVVRENEQAGQSLDTWVLHRERDRTPVRVRIAGPLSSNSGETVRDWCLEGRGIMLRSLWDIAPQLVDGRLLRILPAWSMTNADVHWLAPWRAQVPRRLRLLIDHLAEQFRREPWKATLPRAPQG